jgi:hypothetical protein
VGIFCRRLTVPAVGIFLDNSLKTDCLMRDGRNDEARGASLYMANSCATRIWTARALPVMG